VIGIDRDPEAVKNINLLKKENTEIHNRLTVFHSRFSKLSEIEIRPFAKAQGILFDLGYSTAQVFIAIVIRIITLFSGK
jgi:16S rRNA C1402 N4-methylase RsmH